MFNYYSNITEINLIYYTRILHQYQDRYLVNGFMLATLIYVILLQKIRQLIQRPINKCDHLLPKLSTKLNKALFTR
jgi:hypothetical protein